MKIGINALFLIPNQVGGTEYHLRSFVDALQQLDKKNQYVLFCNNENFDSFILINPKWTKIKCPISASSRIKRILYEQCVFPFSVQKAQCDVLHSYGYFGPLFLLNTKKVITVHDVNWRDHPEDTSFIQNTILRILIELNLFGADLVLTDSHFSYARLLNYFPNIKTKLQIVLPFLNDVFFDKKMGLDHDSTVQKVMKDNRKFLFCVSGFYPHKKILYLLQLWRKFSSKNNQYKLVLVGKNGNDENEINRILPELKNVIHFPNVRFDELLWLYKHSELFIFPSIYEGFGYPVYEAHTLGKKILVGKKEMYENYVSSDVFEMSFNLEIDTELIMKTLNLKTTKKNLAQLLDKQYSVNKLIEMYESLV